jgi:hypothetical protein
LGCDPFAEKRSKTDTDSVAEGTTASGDELLWTPPFVKVPVNDGAFSFMVAQPVARALKQMHAGTNRRKGARGMEHLLNASPPDQVGSTWGKAGDVQYLRDRGGRRREMAIQAGRAGHARRTLPRYARGRVFSIMPLQRISDLTEEA